jgi:folate-binding protein YgfZ
MIQATILSNRGVLSIRGKDKFTFLQGLVTNDVSKIAKGQAIYAALLSPQGKFQYDLFIIADNAGEWLIDCERDRAEMLLKRLSLYKLRSDVTLENRSDTHTVLAVWEGSPPQEEIVFLDPRLSEFGSRMIVPTEKMSEICHRTSLTLAPFDAYDLYRLTWGIPDGSRDILIDRGIILECGFEELKAIDWNKGCYMGQELTARTHYRGLVRKRLLPVRIEGGTPAFQAPIIQDGAEVGDMRTALKGHGIAMIRLEALQKPLPFSCETATVIPYIPEWMVLPTPNLEG